MQRMLRSAVWLTVLVAAIFLGRSLWERVLGSPPVAPHRVTLMPGREMLLVFIGSLYCGASTEKGFPEVFAQVRDKVMETARANNMAFGTIGVTVDWSISDGLEFLQRFGAFDEVVLGRNWLNSGMDRFVRQQQGVEEIPQIVVLVRYVNSGPTSFAITDERVVAARRGTRDIRAWLAEGVPIGMLDDSVTNIKPTHSFVDRPRSIHEH